MWYQCKTHNKIGAEQFRNNKVHVSFTLLEYNDFDLFCISCKYTSLRYLSLLVIFNDIDNQVTLTHVR